jgi:hypothetical protein
VVISSPSPLPPNLNPFRPVPLPLPNLYPSPTGLKIADEASRFWDQSSASGPDGGNLACAFMVNKVLERALGHSYGADPDTVNSVRDDILQRGGRIVSISQTQPGDLALSFNEAALKNIGGATAHIGIFLSPSLIIANSSKNRRFNQIMTPFQFSQLYPYFEVIRPAESLNQEPAFYRWA